MRFSLYAGNTTLYLNISEYLCSIDIHMYIEPDLVFQKIQFRITLISDHGNQIKRVKYDKHSIIDQSSEFQETFTKERMNGCMIECITIIF